ncbi:MAG: hypothetical protein WC462_02350 [archaeon]
MDRKVTSVAIIIIAILLIILVPFVPKEIVEQYGWPVLLAPLVIIIIVLFIAFFVINKQTKVGLIQEERQKITTELKEAEKQFLQHKIDKNTFDSISKEKNAALIKVEADIDAEKKQALPKEELKKAENLSADKRRVLIGLLEQKQKKVHELKLSEQSYLKRKIDEITFQKISSDIKKEIISIESQIRVIHESGEIAKLKEILKEGAMEITKQKKVSAQRGAKSIEEEMEEALLE